MVISALLTRLPDAISSRRKASEVPRYPVHFQAFARYNLVAVLRRSTSDIRYNPTSEQARKRPYSLQSVHCLRRKTPSPSPIALFHRLCLGELNLINTFAVAGKSNAGTQPQEGREDRHR